MSNKSCGSCSNWIKLGSFGGKGICDYFDYGWVGSDHVIKGCSGYRAQKYKRNKRETIKVIQYDN